MESSPEGWYKDPYGRLPFRWWDGNKWSPYARAEEVQWDPIDVEPVTEQRLPGLPTMGVALCGFAVAVGLSYLVLSQLRSHGKPGGLSTELVLTEVALWVPMIAACWIVSRRRGEGSFSKDFGLRWRTLGYGPRFGRINCGAFDGIDRVAAHHHFAATFSRPGGIGVPALHHGSVGVDCPGSRHVRGSADRRRNCSFED